MGARNTDEIEVSEMIVLVYNMPKERQDFFFQRVAMVGQATPDKARDRMIIAADRDLSSAWNGSSRRA
jgi:hypothetical protein